jgi:hypothetical protein
LGKANLVTLQAVTKALPENVQAAFLIAAKKGTIKQGTWDGCAFNAAGQVVDPTGNVNSFSKAAALFKCDPNLVSKFIGVWDTHHSVANSTPTLDLIKCLTSEKSFIDPEAKKREMTIVVYASTLKALSTAFDEGELSELLMEEICPTEFRELVSA